MKKRLSTPAVQDQVVPLYESRSRKTTKPPVVTRLDPTPLGKHRPISYIPGEKPRKEPSVLPRLFIRGHGGSIKLDPSGAGTEFSETVFAHLIADDSLLSLHVCQGDIALIEPAVRRIHSGNLLLLDLDGRSVIRQLKKKGRIWLLRSPDQNPETVIPLVDQGIQGVVVGFVRLFNKPTPVPYEGTEANYSLGFEIPVPRKKRQPEPEPVANPRGRVRLARSLTDIRQFFASNQSSKTKVWLNEIDEAIRYIGRPDKR